ncbi:hypothetical protein ACI4B7_27490, partial [Klebsiella pneumoniae]|uniref:hypothetical protein n=1 Tax=Klebsiella pneumoniae TaxID=573 RepID=UPI003853A0E7
MDNVGNIAESYPITVLNRAIALVDTTPPSGTIRIVDDSHNDINASNQPLVNLALTAYDRVSGVKDARVRGVNITSAQSFDK